MPVGNPLLVREFDEAIDLLEAALRKCPEALWEASLWKVERTDPGMWPANDQPEPGRTDESIQVFSALWKVAYHCLFYLDWYVTIEMMATPIAPEGFFRDTGVHSRGVEENPFNENWTLKLPNHVYRRELLLQYLDYGRARARRVISSLTDDDLAKTCGPKHPHAGKTLEQLLQINLAHLREHGGQIRGFLGKSPHA
jgi:DinB family protein